MATATIRVWAWVATAIVLAAVGRLCIAATQDGPPPPPPRDVRGAVDDLGLSAEQRAKVDPLVADLMRQQRQAREAFLQKVRPALTDEQYRKLSTALAHDGPPDGPPGDSGGELNAAVPPPAPLPPLAAGERRAAVTFTGGHDTDGRDGGRPVVLIAAGLGVPADVFRQTFTHVHPSGPDRGPTDAEARQNKRALLDGLSKDGVTDDRINTVSNYYRYVRSHGQMWRHRPATASAVVRDGKVVRFDIADGGAGYTMPPAVSVEGMPEVAAVATLAFGTNLATNGSVRSIAVAP